MFPHASHLTYANFRRSQTIWAAEIGELKEGVVGFHVNFADETPEVLTCLVFGEYGHSLTCDSYRNISVI